MSPLRAFSLFESVDQFDEEEIFADSAGEPTEFDAVVGAIEDIVVSESFQVTFRAFEMARIIPVSPSLPMSVCNTSPISSRVISLTKSKNLASLAGITNVLISQVLIGQLKVYTCLSLLICTSHLFQSVILISNQFKIIASKG